MRYRLLIITLCFWASLARADRCRASDLWVDWYVQSLYESIPETEFDLSNTKYHISTDRNSDVMPGYTMYASDLFDASGVRKGVVYNKISDDRTELVFEAAELRYVDHQYSKADGFLNMPGVTPLIPDLGVPTMPLLTLHQMRLHGVKAGELVKASTTEVVNVQTSLEIRQHPALANWFAQNPRKMPPYELLEAVILETNTGRYMDTIITQSGHRIAAVSIRGGYMERQKRLIQDYHQEDPKLKTLLAQSAPDVYLPYGFRVYFELEPLTNFPGGL